MSDREIYSSSSVFLLSFVQDLKMSAKKAWQHRNLPNMSLFRKKSSKAVVVKTTDEFDLVVRTLLSKGDNCEEGF